MVNKAPIRVGGESLYKGLKMFRKVKNCHLEIDDDFIRVNYWEYLESPTGHAVEEKYKHYIVKDEPAIMDGETEVKPANLSYSAWAEFIIQQELVGASLGNDVIIGAMRNTLANMPFDVADGYITQP